MTVQLIYAYRRPQEARRKDRIRTKRLNLIKAYAVMILILTIIGLIGGLEMRFQ
jgi:hypothetical protein